jgi:hypothetical protein
LVGVPAETHTQDLPDTIVKLYRYSNLFRDTYRNMLHEYYISLNECGNEIPIEVCESRKEAERKYDG